jgi:hypothetical protein
MDGDEHTELQYFFAVMYACVLAFYRIAHVDT